MSGDSSHEYDCYCGLWDKNPAYLESRGIPRGYCGFCQRCGKPGHLRHFPGAVPFTGCWCDRHYRLLSIFHPLGSRGFVVYGALIALGLWLLLLLD